jgi:hypothetical protein
MITLSVIKYSNANALEVTWKDSEGVNILCKVYSDYQIQQLRSDVITYGGSLQDYESLISEVEAAKVIQSPAAPVVPAFVSMRQARLALLAANKLHLVQSAIDAITDPVQKQAAQITWEYSTEVQRNFGLVQQLAPALGLTEAQIDTLFIQAATL